LDHTISHHAHARILDSEIIAQQHLVSPQNTTHATLTCIPAPCTRARTFPRFHALHLRNFLRFTYTIARKFLHSHVHRPTTQASYMHCTCDTHTYSRARTFPRLALSARLSRACRDMEWTAPALRFTPGPTSNMTSIMRLLLHAPWQFMLCTSSHSAFLCFTHHHSARSCTLQPPSTKCTQ
jgi:hypothetical protein